MTVKQKILSIIGKNRLKLKAFGVRRIGLFGSIAREDHNPRSDVDVLVEFDEQADLFSLVGLSIFLEEKLGAPVDVVSRRVLRKEFQETVLREGVIV